MSMPTVRHVYKQKHNQKLCITKEAQLIWHLCPLNEGLGSIPILGIVSQLKVLIYHSETSRSTMQQKDEAMQ